MKLTIKSIKEIKRNTENKLTKRVCDYVIGEWNDYDDKKHIFTDVLYHTSSLLPTICANRSIISQLSLSLNSSPTNKTVWGSVTNNIFLIRLLRNALCIPSISD